MYSEFQEICSIDLELDRHYSDLVGKSIRIIFIIIYRRTISPISSYVGLVGRQCMSGMRLV